MTEINEVLSISLIITNYLTSVVYPAFLLMQHDIHEILSTAVCWFHELTYDKDKKLLIVHWQMSAGMVVTG